MAPINPNQDLVVFPNRGIHPLSGDFKNCDVEWLLAERKGNYDLVLVPKSNVFLVFFVCDFFLIFSFFQVFMKLCQSMQCSIPGRKTYNPIWTVLPSSRDMFFFGSVCIADVRCYCVLFGIISIYCTQHKLVFDFVWLHHWLWTIDSKFMFMPIETFLLQFES